MSFLSNAVAAEKYILKEDRYEYQESVSSNRSFVFA